jgi:hypothetical protein
VFRDSASLIQAVALMKVPSGVYIVYARGRKENLLDAEVVNGCGLSRVANAVVGDVGARPSGYRAGTETPESA